MCDRGIGTWRGTEPVDPGRADDFWTGSLAAHFLVCVFARRKSRYGLPVFLFVAGMSAGCLRMGAEQAVFSREEGFFREEHEDGVVLQGTVQSVKEKDGTLEVVLRDCAMEGKDGESGEKLRRVLMLSGCE